MRFDKLTTAFQQALGMPRVWPWRATNPYIEPAHLLAAMLQQPDGPKALLERAGADTGALTVAMETAIRNLPQVQGGGETVQPGRDLLQLLQAADKEARNAATSSSLARCSCWRWPMRNPISAASCRGHGLTRKALEAAVEAVRGGQKSIRPRPKASARR